MKAFWILALVSLLYVPTNLLGEEPTNSTLATSGQHDGEHTGIDGHVLKIRYAKASDIKRILDEVFSFLSEVKDDFVLDGRLQQEDFLRGRFKIVADDRTNKLIILTRRANMSLFERYIEVLDVELGPAHSVQQTSGGDSTNRANTVRGTTQK